MLAGIRDLVPNLRSIQSSSFTVGNIFLDQIRKFEDLEELALSTKSSKYIDLLELENLKVVELRVYSDNENVEKVTHPVKNLRQLSLDKFVIYARTPSPLLIHFLRSIKAKDVTLKAGKHVTLMSQGLAALDHSITSQMTLYSYYTSPFILDSQLNRITLLRHLTLGRGIKFTESFFKAIFRTPLISLRLNKDFDLDAQNLIDALKDPARAKQLKRLELNNIEVVDEEYTIGGCGARELPDCWTDKCTQEHVAELMLMAREWGFELTGTTAEAVELCEDIVEQNEVDVDGYHFDDHWEGYGSEVGSSSSYDDFVDSFFSPMQ
jgi:hypothetical protein